MKKILLQLCLISLFGFSPLQSFAWNSPTISSPAVDATVFVGINLNWNSVSNSQAYQLQVDTSANFNSPLFYTVTKAYINTVSSNSDTQDNPPNLRFGQRYHWRVRAYITGDTSAWTSSTFITNDFVAQTSPNAIDTWTGTTINWQVHTGVSFYDMQADTVNTFNSPALQSVSIAYINSTDGNNDTQSFLSNLFFGKIYYWRVRARNAVDTSSWSPIWTFTTRDYVNQTAPNAIETWTGTTINWQVHTGVVSYQMQADTLTTFNSPALRAVTNAYINSTDGNSDTESYLANLFFGKTYYWRVRAINSVDTSSWSPVWTFTTRDYVNQTSPNATDTWTGTTINWAPHSGVAFYDVQVDTATTFNSPDLRNQTTAYINSTDGNGDTQWFATDLLFGKTYYWRVRARNSVDTSSWSSAWSFQTRNYVTMTSPADAATNVSLNPTLNWAPHAGIVKYQQQLDVSNLYNTGAFVEVFKNYVNSTDGNTDTQQGYTGLAPNTVYFWRVRAIHNRDTSAWSERWFSTGTATPVFPQAPTTSFPICGSQGQALSGLSLQWNAVTGADAYDLEFRLSSATFTGNATQSAISGTSLNPGTLAENTAYCWRVRSIDNGIAGAWGELCCFQTLSQVAISAPQPSEAGYCQSASLTLPFVASGNFNSDNNFVLEMSDATGNFSAALNLGSVSGTSSGTFNVSLPLSSAGNGYRLRVRSTNPAFTSPPSSEIALYALPVLEGDLNTIVCLQTSTLELPEVLPAGGLYSGNTVSGTQFFPSQAGAGSFPITYSYTSNQGCTSTLVGQVIVDACTAIANTEMQPIFNSTGQAATMQFPQPVQGCADVLDLSGRRCFSQQWNGDLLFLQAGTLKPGMYFVHWKSSNVQGIVRWFIP